jgi:MFS family permease
MCDTVVYLPICVLEYNIQKRFTGYLIGTLGSALLIEIQCLEGAKMLLVSGGIFLSGMALALMPKAASVWGMYVLIGIQGLGFGSVDALCNIVLPEVWGDRVQVRY